MRRLLLVSFLVACGPPEDPGDAGIDGGAAMDAALDAGTDAGDLEDAGPPPTPLRVLFVGNSYTYQNSLPSVVAAISEASGQPLEVEVIGEGGARLSTHWQSTGARERIEMGALDRVVLQGQSLESIMGAKGFFGFGALLAEAIEATGAETVWFATWARGEGHAIYSPDWGPDRMARSIDFSYQSAADSFGGTVARVGAAFELARLELPEVGLYTADLSHASPAGALLAACVLAQELSGQTPVLPTPTPLDVDTATAEALCALAPRVLCREGWGECDGACVNLQGDPAHCGACGVTCDADDPCRAGVCGCDAGFTGCERACVDLDTNLSHCGACGVGCTLGEVCDAGSCACVRASTRTIDHTTLSALEPGCGSLLDRGGLACAVAAHAHCTSLACFTSGYGPPSGHAPLVDALACVIGDVRSTDYTELGGFDAGCVDPTSCATAIDRYCVGLGAVSGYGPVSDVAGALSVVCLDGAVRESVATDTLRGFGSRCTEPDPVTCSVAAWSYCETLGHPGGFGPVANDGTTAEVVCFTP